MSKSKVPLYQAPQRFVLIDPEATKGATVGVDVWNKDGSLFVPASTPAGEDDVVSRTLWSLVLQIPANVTALEKATGTGLFAVTGSGAGALRTLTGTAGRVTVANPDGVTGNPTIDLATVVDAGGGTLQRTAFDTYGRKTGTSAATTTDLPEGANLYHTAARVLATVLTGLSTATNAVITATDSVLVALGKLQAQISAIVANYVTTARTISTTAPLTGGGDLSANRTLAISAATTAAAGSMSAADKSKLDAVTTGTYTPVTANVTNSSARTPYVCMYTRVGDTVTVAGRVDQSAVAAGSTLTQFSLTLPIPSNLAVNDDLAGVGALLLPTGTPAIVSGDLTGDLALVSYYATTTGATALLFNFTYRVL